MSATFHIHRYAASTAVRVFSARAMRRFCVAFSRNATAIGMMYIQWADMMYTSLMPKPRPTCSTMSRAK